MTQSNGARLDTDALDDRQAAAAYVDALGRGTLPPDSPLARRVEAKDPEGRLRLLGLSLRELRLGRPQDAAARLRGLRLRSQAARQAIAAQIELIANLPVRRPRF